MTRVFVMTNHKGGVGKSTSATNIAFGMVQVLRQAGAANSRVLLNFGDLLVSVRRLAMSQWWIHIALRDAYPSTHG